MPDASSPSRTRPGPKTVAGKAKVARNALRHGLAATAVGEARSAAQVEALAEAVVGPKASFETREAALAFAHAQIDLQRVQSVRKAVWEVIIAQTDTLDPATPAGRERRSSCFTKGIADLVALDRYERRARARRKRAIRALKGAAVPRAPRHMEHE